MRKAEKSPSRAASGARSGPRRPSYGALGNLVGFAVRRLHIYLSSGLLDLLDEEGMRQHQFPALSLIVDNPAISQSELGKALGIKPSNVVPLVNDMVERGYVLRNADPHTRRRYALMATTAGRKVRERVLARMTEHDRVLTQFLSDKEREWLLSLLQRISTHPTPEIKDDD